jgi:hypothetical protein
MEKKNKTKRRLSKFESPLKEIGKKWAEKDEFGLTSLDRSQVEELHKIMFSEENLEEFKKSMGAVDWQIMHQFLNGCFFLHDAKNLKAKYCSSTKYVLLFTAIESIMGVVNYHTFDEWLRAKKYISGIIERDKIIKEINSENFNEKIKDLFMIYIKHYGITEHVREFFRKYIDIEDKKKIILSMEYENKKENIIAPKCLISKEACFIEEFSGRKSFTCLKQEKRGCILFKSENEINKIFDTIISILYDIFRNKVIHEGARSHILESFKCEGVCAGNTLLLIHKRERKKRIVRIKDGLNIDNFRAIIIKGVKKYYEEEIKQKK